MYKKDKKIFKEERILSQKISINKRWTNWRKFEMSNKMNLLLNEIKNLIVSSLYKNKNSLFLSKKTKINYRQFIQNKINSKKGFISKNKNYCYYIGRSRSYNRNLFMARHTFRKFARFGMLPGFIKERC